jgi:hypothetical protein
VPSLVTLGKSNLKRMYWSPASMLTPFGSHPTVQWSASPLLFDPLEFPYRILWIFGQQSLIPPNGRLPTLVFRSWLPCLKARKISIVRHRLFELLPSKELKRVRKAPSLQCSVLLLPLSRERRLAKLTWRIWPTSISVIMLVWHIAMSYLWPGYAINLT